MGATTGIGFTCAGAILVTGSVAVAGRGGAITVEAAGARAGNGFVAAGLTSGAGLGAASGRLRSDLCGGNDGVGNDAGGEMRDTDRGGSPMRKFACAAAVSSDRVGE